MEVSEFKEGMRAVLIEDIPQSSRYVKGVEVVVNKGPEWDQRSATNTYIKNGTVMTYISLPGDLPFAARQKCYLRRLRPLGAVQLSFDFGE